MKQLFYWLGGHSGSIAAKCTSDEQLRLAAKGALVLVPALLAFVSMLLAVWYVSHHFLYALLGGVFWFVIILINDRAIMTLNSEAGSISMWFRILFSIVSSITVAEVMILLIFNSSIAQQKFLETKEFIDGIEESYQLKIDGLGKEYQALKDGVEQKRNAYINEVDGSDGTGVIGEGTVGRIKKEALAIAVKQLSQDSTRIFNKLDQLKIKHTQDIEAHKDAVATDIPSLINALHQIKEGYIPFAVWVLRIFFVLIEMLPLFTKFSKARPYDMYVKIVEKLAKAKMKRMDNYISVETEQVMMQLISTYSKEKLKNAYEKKLEKLQLHSSFIHQSVALYQKQMLEVKKIKDQMTDENHYQKIYDGVDNLWSQTFSSIPDIKSETP